MPVSIAYATDEDSSRAFEIENAAYANAGDAISGLLFPGPHPPDSTQKRSAEFVKAKAADPSTVWLKAVDDDTGEMIAFAEWHIYEPDTPRPEPRPRQFGPGSNPEVCKWFFGSIDAKREQLMGDKPHLCEWIQTGQRG